MSGFIVISDSVRSWDVIVVPFPHSERLAEKRRPALVISGETLHREGYLWIVMITGAGKTARIGDVFIGDLDAAGLPGASMVRTSKLATIESERVLCRIGRLAKTENAAVKKTLVSLLAA